LLKGCTAAFEAGHWRERYCGERCRGEARRWHARRRQRKRRRRVSVREEHRDDERSRRDRIRDERARAAQEQIASAAVVDLRAARGHANAVALWHHLCARPGCYEAPRATVRAPTVYCEDACGQAVRRVLDRERKWRLRATPAGRLKRQLGQVLRSSAIRTVTRSP